MALSFLRILAASALRRGASAADDATADAVAGALGRLDRFLMARRGSRATLHRAFAVHTGRALDAALHVSGLVSGCGCTDDDADGCERDGQTRRCGCGCHTALGVLS